MPEHIHQAPKVNAPATNMHAGTNRLPMTPGAQKERDLAELYQKKQDTLIQRYAPNGIPLQVPVMQAKESPTGKGLPKSVKGKMENSFGTDFSTVQLHTDSSQARDLGALAYTQGENIHFAPGQFDTGSQRGQALLGHELTHVVQQRQGRVQPTVQAKGLAVNDDKGLEREADEWGGRAAISQVTKHSPTVAVGLPTQNEASQRADTQNGPIQKADLKDEELLAELKNPKSKYNADELHGMARSHSNANFKTAFGANADDLASDVLVDLYRDIEAIYGFVELGIIDAVNSVEATANEEKQKQALLQSMMVSCLAMVGAFLPVLTSSIASQFKNVNVIAWKGVTKAIMATDKAEFKFLYEGLKQTVRLQNPKIRGGKNFSQWKAEAQSHVLALKLATTNSADSILLRTSMEMKVDPDRKRLNVTDSGLMEADVRRIIRAAIFPDFAELGFMEDNKYRLVQGYVKHQYLKDLVVAGTRLRSSADSELSSRMGGQGDIAEYALSSLENEKEGLVFKKMFSMPEEYAWAALQSRLSQIGITFDPEDEMAPQNNSKNQTAMKKGVLYCTASITDVGLFNAALSGGDRISHGVMPDLRSGPLEDIEKKYPTESNGLFSSSQTRYRSVYEENTFVPATKVIVYLNNDALIYSSNRKMADYSTFATEFEANGYAIIETAQQHVGKANLLGPKWVFKKYESVPYGKNIVDWKFF